MARKRQGFCPTSQNHLIHCQAQGYLGGFLTQLPQTYNLPSLSLLCFLHTFPQLSISPFLFRISEPSGHTSICSSQERILVPNWKEGLCWRKARLLVSGQEHREMTGLKPEARAGNRETGVRCLTISLCFSVSSPSYAVTSY